MHFATGKFTPSFKLVLLVLPLLDLILPSRTSSRATLGGDSATDFVKLQAGLSSEKFRPIQPPSRRSSAVFKRNSV